MNFSKTALPYINPILILTHYRFVKKYAAVDTTYVVVSIIFLFLFGLGLCALEGSFINYDLAIGRFDFRPLGV
jgi:hypothetical protein